MAAQDDKNRQVELAMMRMQKLRRNKQTLETLALQSIVSNINLFTLMEDPFATLAYPLRDVVLRELLGLERSMMIGSKDDLDLVLTAVLRLLNDRTEAVDFSNLLATCPRPFMVPIHSRLIGLAANHASNLKELTIGYPQSQDDECIENEDILLLPVIRHHLKNLKKLLLDEAVRINFAQLVELCNDLPDLKDLRIYLHQPDEKQVELVNKRISHLGSLKVLDNTAHFDVVEDTLVELFAENYPHLEYCCPNYLGFRFSDIPELGGDAGTATRCYLQVEKVDLENLLSKNEQLYRKYPNITHLSIGLSDSEPDLFHDVQLHKLGNVRKLSLHSVVDDLNQINSHEDVLNSVLDELGRNLHTLYVDGSGSISYNYSVQKIIDRCPTLEKLHLNFVYLDESVPDEGVLCHLKDITLTECDYGYYAKEFLESILLAPNLQKLRFDIPSTCDLSDVVSLIASRKILANLESLHLEFSFNSPECDRVVSTACLLRQAAAYLPKLAEFSVSVACSYTASKADLLSVIGDKNGSALVTNFKDIYKAFYNLDIDENFRDEKHWEQAFSEQ